MSSHETFEKRRKMAASKGYLGPHRDVEEFGVVDPHGGSALTTAEISADVGGQSDPAVEVIGDAGAQAPGIRFQRAAHRKRPSRKQAVHIGAGIEKGVSSVHLPFWRRLILRRRER